MLKAKRQVELLSRWWPTASATANWWRQIEELRAVPRCAAALLRRPQARAAGQAPAPSGRRAGAARCADRAPATQQREQQRSEVDDCSRPSPTTAATASSAWRRRSASRKQERNARQHKAAALRRAGAQALGEPPADDEDAFLAQRQPSARRCARPRAEREADLQNELTERGVALRQGRQEHDAADAPRSTA